MDRAGKNGGDALASVQIRKPLPSLSPALGNPWSTEAYLKSLMAGNNGYLAVLLFPHGYLLCMTDSAATSKQHNSCWLQYTFTASEFVVCMQCDNSRSNRGSFRLTKEASVHKAPAPIA